MSYIIGSGWWCDGTNQHAGSINNSSVDLTRSKEFFNVWLHFVRKFTNPKKVIITDSRSPVLPETLVGMSLMSDPFYRDFLEFIKLSENYLHASVCNTKLCGWTRGFLNGAFYAFMNDADYVYIEQDCLIYGSNIIEDTLAIMNQDNIDYCHGTWEHAYKVEQSFVIIRKEAILKFISIYCSFDESDRQMRPELKFLKMGDSLSSINGNLVFKELSFGYGRRRPIDFSDNKLYCQHLNKEELIRFLDLDGLKLSNFFTDINQKKEKY